MYQLPPCIAFNVSHQQALLEKKICDQNLQLSGTLPTHSLTGKGCGWLAEWRGHHFQKTTCQSQNWNRRQRLSMNIHFNDEHCLDKNQHRTHQRGQRFLLAWLSSWTNTQRNRGENNQSVLRNVIQVSGTSWSRWSSKRLKHYSQKAHSPWICPSRADRQWEVSLSMPGAVWGRTMSPSKQDKAEQTH